MNCFGEDMVSDMYIRHKKHIEIDKWRDKEYSKRYNYLMERVEALRKDLNPEQNMLMEELLCAMQIFNEYNEFKRFGNGMRCMYDFERCLKDKY